MRTEKRNDVNGSTNNNTNNNEMKNDFLIFRLLKIPEQKRRIKLARFVFTADCILDITM